MGLAQARPNYIESTITSVMIYHRGASLSEQHTDLLCTKQDLSHTSSGVAKLGHTGARALATGGCAPPPVQALLKIIGAEFTVINRELGAKSAQRCSNRAA